MQVLPVFMEFFVGFIYYVLDFTGFYGTDLKLNGCYGVLRGFDGFHWVSLVFTGFHLKWNVFLGFLRVEPGLTAFEPVFNGFYLLHTGFHWVSLLTIDLPHWVLLSFPWILLGFYLIR